MRKIPLLFALFLLGASPAISRAHAASIVTPGETPTATTSGATTTAPPRSAAPGASKLEPSSLPRVEGAPTIDGRLDDEIWKSATIFKDFVQIHPGDNTGPSKPTEVLVAYDASSLYVAFRAHDDARAVRATIPKRDFIFDDDTVGIYLDTYFDHRKAYALYFNPHGVQADGIYTEGKDQDYLKSVDFSVDIVMESKGALTADGYLVEVAIPFKSLRYEAGAEKFWGLHLFRQIKHFDNEQNSWMPISRDRSALLAQEGRLTTDFGNVWEGRTLELIPSIMVSEDGRRVGLQPTEQALDPSRAGAGRFVNAPAAADLGLNLKLGLSPTVTLDFAYNPDFAQVEADQIVVTANQRFPIFYEEKRPFFLEGIDAFQTPLTPVHTRAIVDPDQAMKLTGKVGRNTFGLLVANDNGPGNFTGDERLNAKNLPFLDRNAHIGVLRLKRDVGRESSVGFVATTYNFIQRHNHVAGFDGRFRLSPTRVVSFQVLGTTSRRSFFDPELGKNTYRTGNGFAYTYALDQKGRNWIYSATGEGRTRDYRADVGFTRRTDTNSVQQLVRYNSTPRADSALMSWRFTNVTVSQFDWRGRIQNFQNEPSLRFNLRRQTYFNFGLNVAYDQLFEEEFGRKRTETGGGTFIGDDAERQSFSRTIFFRAGTAPTKKYSANLLIAHAWNEFDFDFGAGPRFPRVSPAALEDPDAKLDPGPGNALTLQANLTYQPTDALRLSLDYTWSRLVRHDTNRLAFDDHIYSVRGVYQFTRFTFARARVDIDSLSSVVRGQFLVGWAPSPGTSFYAGFNDDLRRNGYSPFTGDLEPGIRRQGRTFFIKMSYLFRRNL